MKTNLNIFGIEIEIESNKNISEWVKHDYRRYIKFQENKIHTPNIKINLQNKQHKIKLPSLTASKYHDDYIIYDTPKVRIIDFINKALMIYNLQKKEIDIYSENTDKLYEIFALAFESILGEELDKKGFHRIHCLALEKNNKATILLLPPGAGKTTLALKFLEDKKSDIKVLTEDTALMIQNKIYGLHFRWGIRTNQTTNYKGRIMKQEKYSDKIILDTKDFNLAISAEPKNIIVGKRNLSDNCEINPIRKQNILMPLIKSTVLGLELQQSLATFILKNFKDGILKSKIGFSRASKTKQILSKSDAYEFVMGNNIEKNYKTLKEFMEKHG